MSIPVKGMSIALNWSKRDFHLTKIIMMSGFLNVRILPYSTVCIPQTHKKWQEFL